MERFEIYKDKDGEWRWRLIAKNNRTVAVSGEGFRRKGQAVKSIALLRSLAPTAGIVEQIA